MRVVSVIPESFQEYEDHISIILFFFGCNLRCSYCYNYDSVTNPYSILKETPEELVSRYVSPLTDGLVLLGGEPTIYKNKILDFSKWVKQTHGLDIKLFTNGSNPGVVIEGLKTGVFDKVSIDFKFLYTKTVVDFGNCINNVNSYVQNITSLLEKLYCLNLSNRVEARTTQCESISDEEVALISAICERVGIPHIVQFDVSDSYKRIGVI